MAIITNTLKSNSLNLSSLPIVGPSFTATKSDTNLLLYPGSSPERQCISRGISIDRADEAIKVTYIDGTTDTFEAGMLAAGVIHPIQIIQVWSTGTGSNVKIKIWL